MCSLVTVWRSESKTQLIQSGANSLDGTANAIVSCLIIRSLPICLYRDDNDVENGRPLASSWTKSATRALRLERISKREAKEAVQKVADKIKEVVKKVTE